MDQIVKNYNKYVNLNKSPKHMWNSVCLRIRGRDQVDEVDSIESECIIENRTLAFIINTSGISHYTVFDELHKKCNCEYISGIDLSDNMYSPYQFNKVMNSLMNMNTLSIDSLNLSNNNISDKSFKLLLEFISSKSCRNLLSLNLDNNILTNACMKLFKNNIIFGVCSHLRYLDLSNNVYDYKGIKSFSKVLYRGYLPELEQITLTCKKIPLVPNNCLSNAIQNGALKRKSLKSVMFNDEDILHNSFPRNSVDSKENFNAYEIHSN